MAYQNRNTASGRSTQSRPSKRNTIDRKSYERSSYQGRGRRNQKRKKKQKSGCGSFLLLLISVIVIISGVILYNRFYKVPYKYSNYISKYSKDYKVDKELVAAIIYNESRFNPKAQSNQDARGLMQIQPETGNFISEKLSMESYSHDSLYDPETNIKMGTWYIGYLIERFGSMDTAIAAYNAGPTNVDKWLDDPNISENGKLVNIPFKDTKQYVKDVLRMKKEYERLIQKTDGM